MSASAKKVHWRNGVQNHQNGQPLLVLDPKIKGYENIGLFQWERCVQFHSRGASEKGPTTDVGDKIRRLIVKLQEMHGKEKFLMFTDDGKIIQLKTLLKKVTEIKSYLNYMVHDRWKNISLVLHVMSSKSFQDLKNPIFNWLQMNK
eukprot:7346441-Ditylum_brightwellii.AAC.1